MTQFEWKRWNSTLFSMAYFSDTEIASDKFIDKLIINDLLITLIVNKSY